MGAYTSIDEVDHIVEEYSNHRYVAPRWGINAWSNLGDKNSKYWTSKSRFCKIPTEFYNRDKSGWFY